MTSGPSRCCRPPSLLAQPPPRPALAWHWLLRLLPGLFNRPPARHPLLPQPTPPSHRQHQPLQQDHCLGLLVAVGASGEGWATSPPPPAPAVLAVPMPDTPVLTVRTGSPRRLLGLAGKAVVSEASWPHRWLSVLGFVRSTWSLRAGEQGTEVLCVSAAGTGPRADRLSPANELGVLRACARSCPVPQPDAVTGPGRGRTIPLFICCPMAEGSGQCNLCPGCQL